jgi:molecular chaperone GrpE (heat shock protein)
MDESTSKAEASKNVIEEVSIPPRNKEPADDESESTVDDEEIKRKEADLDNAIREEELLEEELLQVEKEFERVRGEDLCIQLVITKTIFKKLASLR